LILKLFALCAAGGTAKTSSNSVILGYVVFITLRMFVGSLQRSRTLADIQSTFNLKFVYEINIQGAIPRTWQE
jgi:hypothetical protein